MNLWHQTEDAKCTELREDGLWWLYLEIGSWPIERGQAIEVDYTVGQSGRDESARCRAFWGYNEGPNNYWHAKHAPFAAGKKIEYSIARSPLLTNYSEAP